MAARAELVLGGAAGSELARIAATDPKAAERILRSRQPSTWKQYLRHLAVLRGWLAERGETLDLPLRHDLLLAWLGSLVDQGRAASTVGVAAAAVSALHQVHGLESPTMAPLVRQFLRGAAREASEGRPTRQADPILPVDLRAMLARATVCPAYQRVPLLLTRDLSLVLVGFAGGFRRSELASMTVDQLDLGPDALVVELATAKARYTGEPHRRRIVRSEHDDTCPVAALETWLAASGVREGLVWRRFAPRATSPAHEGISGATVDAAVRRLVAPLRAERVGRQPRWSAHSLRAGLATAASLAGRADREIAEHLGHRSTRSTERYVRTGRVMRSELTRGLL